MLHDSGMALIAIHTWCNCIPNQIQQLCCNGICHCGFDSSRTKLDVWFGDVLLPYATGELKCNWKIKIRIEFVWEGMLVNAKLWLLFSVICCHDIWPPSARGLKQIFFKHLYPSRLVHGQVQKRHSLIFSSKIQLLAVSSRLHTNFAYINEQCCWDHSTSLLTILRNIIILRNIQTSWKQFSSGMVSWHLCVAASWKK